MDVDTLDDKAKGMLTSLDKNGDGKVSLGEFVPTIVMLTLDKSEDELRKLVEACKAGTAAPAGADLAAVSCGAAALGAKG